MYIARAGGSPFEDKKKEKRKETTSKKKPKKKTVTRTEIVDCSWLSEVGARFQGEPSVPETLRELVLASFLILLSASRKTKATFISEFLDYGKMTLGQSVSPAGHGRWLAVLAKDPGVVHVHASLLENRFPGTDEKALPCKMEASAARCAREEQRHPPARPGSRDVRGVRLAGSLRGPAEGTRSSRSWTCSHAWTTRTRLSGASAGATAGFLGHTAAAGQQHAHCTEAMRGTATRYYGSWARHNGWHGR